jgi:hypothetical protein
MATGDLRELHINIAVPVGAIPIDTRYVQELCTQVERLVRNELPDARYVDHEIHEAMVAA